MVLSLQSDFMIALQGFEQLSQAIFYEKLYHNQVWFTSNIQLYIKAC